jgi:hypothetical protein
MDLYNNNLYIFGGYGSGLGYRKELFRYDIINNKFIEIKSTNTPEARRKHCSVIYNDVIWIFGGAGSSSYFDDLWNCELGILFLFINLSNYFKGVISIKKLFESVGITSQNAQKYEKIFEDNQLDINSLNNSNLNNNLLKDIGIDILGDRIKILNLFTKEEGFFLFYFILFHCYF